MEKFSIFEIDVWKAEVLSAHKFLMAICRISFKDFRKLLTATNWLFHRILHVDISKKWPSDGRFELFLVDFLLFENKKVTLNGEIPGPTQMVPMLKFSRKSLIQPKT